LRNVRLAITVVVAMAVGASCVVGSTDWNRYYQFRHVSTLPGNAFGVTPDGKISFSGALQQNIPVAYTPCAGNYITGFWSGSNFSHFDFGFSGDVNGTASVGVGLGKAGRAAYFSVMFTDSDWRQAYNVQLQLLGETDEHPAVAIGANDIFNMRQKIAGIPHGARSVYITSPWQRGTAEHPVFITAGLGNGRFDSGPFAGVSWGLADHFTAIVEYDGLNTNAGLAYGLRGRQANSGEWDGVIYVGYSNLEHPVVGMCVTYSH